METILRDFAEYQHKAIRTMRPDPFLQQVLHCTMGMVGEAGEFMELDWSETDKLVAEVGDCMWYAAVLSEVMGLSLAEIMVEATVINTDRMGPFVTKAGESKALIWACRLTDLVKKSVFYGKELDRAQVQTMLTHYWAAMLHICAKLSVPALHAATLNIRKLETRFPDKMFDAMAAQHRDTAKEGVHFTGVAHA